MLQAMKDLRGGSDPAPGASWPSVFDDWDFPFPPPG